MNISKRENVATTLNRHCFNVVSPLGMLAHTLNRRCFNVVCSLGIFAMLNRRCFNVVCPLRMFAYTSNRRCFKVVCPLGMFAHTLNRRCFNVVCPLGMFAHSKHSQRAHNVKIASIQHCCNSLTTLNYRWIKVVLTLCAYWFDNLNSTVAIVHLLTMTNRLATVGREISQSHPIRVNTRYIEIRYSDEIRYSHCNNLYSTNYSL